MRSSAYRPDRRHFMHTATSGLACLIGSIRGLAAERQWTAIRHLIDGYVADKKMAGASVAISYGDARSMQRRHSTKTASAACTR
jgi:hypothetical protein